MVTIHDSSSEATSGENFRPPALGPALFSAFYALVNILQASIRFYVTGQELSWLVSPCLLIVGALVIYRAVLLRRDVPKVIRLASGTTSAEAQRAFLNLARTLLGNFSFGMYGIGSSLLLVSWLSRGHT